MSPEMIETDRGLGIRFSIGHGDYNGLEDTDGTKKLLLCESAFVQGLSELLHTWNEAKVYLGHGDCAWPLSILRTVKFVPANLSASQFIAIPQCSLGWRVLNLSEKTLVTVPVADFFEGTILYFQDCPSLYDLVGWTADFRINFAKRWKRVVGVSIESEIIYRKHRVPS